jgi:hypothetical protein
MSEQWNLICDELIRLLDEESKARTIVHRHMRSVPAREMGFEAVVKETRLRSAGVDQEIEASLASWQWGQSLATISDEAQMWRYVRLNTALQVWLPILALQSNRPVLRDPAVSPEEFLRWVLKDWWHLGGVQVRAMYEMSC